MVTPGDRHSSLDGTLASRFSRRTLIHRGLAVSLGITAFPGLLAACTDTAAPPADPAQEPDDEGTGVDEPDDTEDDDGVEDDDADTDTAGTGGRLITTRMGDFLHLDPWFTPQPQRPLLHNVFDSLVRYDESLTVHPRLAESWELGDDGLELTLTLREGVLFHNGREFVADDVVWNVERMRDQSIGHAVFGLTTTLDHAEANDMHSVTLFYNEQTPGLFDALTFAVMILPESGETAQSDPVGTGPFRFQEWIPNDHATFVRFDDYWNAPLPHVDEVEVRAGADQQAQIIALRAGQVHIAEPVPLRDVERVEEDEETYISSSTLGAFYHFSMNPHRAPFEDKLVRQAIAWSIDRERIVDRVLFGYSAPTNVIFEETSWAYAADLDGSYGFDLDRARELLEEAGQGDGFEFTCITVSAFPVWREMATILQADLESIGVTMNIAEYDSAQGYPLVQSGDFEAHMWHSGRAHKDPTTFFGTQGSFRADDTTQNAFRQGEEYEEYRELIIQGAQTFDEDERYPIYHRLQEIVIDVAFAVPIARFLDVIGMRQEVEGFEWEIDNNWYLENVRINQ